VPASPRRSQRPYDIWPGFVDALASLLIALIFVLVMFIIAQFFLGEAISGKDVAIDRLRRQIAELAEMLNLEREAGAELKRSLAQLSEELRSSVERRDRLAEELERTRAGAEASARAAESATSEVERLSGQLAGERARAGEAESALTSERELSASARAEVELLNRQIAALREELARIAAALEVAETQVKEQNVQISDLGRRLNVALAGKVEELARYRSEFFGRLREILGDRLDIQVVGDRFVFQSEVLFDTGSAVINVPGREQLVSLADALNDLGPRIPPDIAWVLQVNGHTDRRPINTPLYPSNWELSSARATAVVKFLIQSGVPSERLAATGFGEHQPIDAADSDEAWRRNRRIELKLTQP